MPPLSLVHPRQVFRHNTFFSFFCCVFFTGVGVLLLGVVFCVLFFFLLVFVFCGVFCFCSIFVFLVIRLRLISYRVDIRWLFSVGKRIACLFYVRV